MVPLTRFPSAAGASVERDGSYRIPVDSVRHVTSPWAERSLITMQNHSPSVSVVIPTFNRGDLLVRAIESVLRQTYLDYEIIIVDDGSTDHTRDRLKPYRRRIRYYYQENRGASAAQNIGVQLAKGEWIAILASDDTWLPNKLESQIWALDIMGQEFDACFTNCVLVGDPHRRGTTFEEAGFRPNAELGELREPVEWVIARYPILFMQSVLIKREVLVQSGGFDNQMVVAEDTDLLFRLGLHAKFCFVNQALVNIDIRPDRTDRLTRLFRIADDRAFSSKEIMFQKWLRLLDGDPNTALRRKIAESLIVAYYDWFKSHIKSSQWSKLPDLIGKIWCCGVGHGKYLKLLGMLSASGARTIRRGSYGLVFRLSKISLF